MTDSDDFRWEQAPDWLLDLENGYEDLPYLGEDALDNMHPIDRIREKVCNHIEAMEREINAQDTP